MKTSTELSLTPLTMSSREIAELTGKRHPDVKRDIQVMFRQLEDNASRFAHIYFDSQNRQQIEYLLPRRECEILITGYDIKRRAAVIDRWYELESGQAQPRYATPPDPDPLHRPDFIRAYIRITALNLCLDHLSLKEPLINSVARS
ncbi:Rha family transcriptional regulator [Thiorhodospira sibirica]|uniref:Rha family transcriptional regulator n=1 Tax=Thiorhodospira sibirica TaxID=154347 RepID=UPI00022C059F|nr:Rha family transcriptional regulator [Thiorhodospira sibirica]